MTLLLNFELRCRLSFTNGVVAEPFSKALHLQCVLFSFFGEKQTMGADGNLRKVWLFKSRKAHNSINEVLMLDIVFIYQFSFLFLGPDFPNSYLRRSAFQ